MTFWNSHLLGGKATPEAIIAHLMLLFRLMQRHGAVFSCRYARLFLANTQDTARYSPDIDLCKLLAEKDQVLYSELCDESRKGAGKGSGSGKNSGGSERPDPPRPRSPSSGKGKGKKGKKGKGPSFPPHPPAVPSEKKHVCLFHNPKERSYCRKGSACPDEHLNTNEPHLFTRWFNAAKIMGWR